MASTALKSIITEAAEQIGNVDPQSILQKLEQEKIVQDWQLDYLDSQQWKMLGVPMGLVASIRKCQAEKANSGVTSPSTSSGLLKMSSPVINTFLYPKGQQELAGTGDDDPPHSTSTSTSTPLETDIFWEGSERTRSIAQYSSRLETTEATPTSTSAAGVVGRPRIQSMDDSPLTIPQRRESVTLSMILLRDAILEDGPAENTRMNAPLHAPPPLPVRLPSIAARITGNSSISSWDAFEIAEDIDSTSDLNTDPLSLQEQEGIQGEPTNEMAMIGTVINESPSTWINRILTCSLDKGVVQTSPMEAMSTPPEVGNSSQNQRGLERIRQYLMKNVDVKTRRYHFKDYPDCFVASEMVDFMVKQDWVQTRAEAVGLGQVLQSQLGWFEHVVEPRRHWFSDKYLFFKFNDGVDQRNFNIGPPPRPTRMLSVPSHLALSLARLQEDSEHSADI